jgi:hypothetical protein
MMTQGFKANPGLKLANAFSVLRVDENAAAAIHLVKVAREIFRTTRHQTGGGEDI